MKWAFDRKLLLLAAGIVLIAALVSCSKDEGAPGPAAGGVIKPSDIAFPGMQLRPGGNASPFTLIGRIKNRSPQATLTEVTLRMIMEDVLASGASTTVASTNIVMRQTVPPGESRDFEEKFEFGALPKPKGRLEWNYSVVEVKGK